MEREKRRDLAKERSADDARAIKQWLVLSPIPYNGVDGLPVLDDELIPNEAGLRPRVKQTVTIDGKAYEWTDVHLEDYLLELHHPDEKKRTERFYCAGYAVTYLVMKVGSAQQAKITLNGREIYRKTDMPGWEPDRDTVTGIRLKAGEWSGSVRIMEAEGQPVPGLRFALNPDG